MAGKTTTTEKKKSQPSKEDEVVSKQDSPRPRLHKLTIRNFRCIGSTPVEIELDDIVVLVGPNNAGKSSILRAYALVMNDGSKNGHLTIDDFPNRLIDSEHLPEIELETIVVEANAPAEKWIRIDPDTQEMFVREKWMWMGEKQAAKRCGWLEKEGKWAENEVPWGAANVANARRPQPHRIDAFEDPETQAKATIELLKGIIEDGLKSLKDSKDDAESKSYVSLLEQLGSLQTAIVDKAKEQISDIEKQISDTIHDVFPGYKISFDPRAEEELENCIKWFNSSPKLLMGPQDGYLSSIENQGSGARRTLLWAALRIIKERSQKNSSERPHLLLLDEPELCLHPDAIREACRVLYELPNSKNWQVMITTHSPVFIDFSKDNTTIIRVERTINGAISSTTLFKPTRTKLDGDDRQRLKMLNICDPYVAEFLFNGKTILVEGDTEFTAFKQVIASNPAKYKDIHIVRARGKATIVSICKILNQFEARYAILHDSDNPITIRKTGKNKGQPMANPAWTHNQKIRDVVKSAPKSDRIRLVASIPNVEEAYFGELLDSEKPYNALLQMKSDDDAFAKTEKLLNALINFNADLPEGAYEWTDIKELEKKVAESIAP
jgi:putative ATP-dependent endonuclease of the OLD family